MNRSFLALALSLAAACSPRGETQVPPQPAARNVVILCIDTLRTDQVGAYGQRRDTTPNIDRLAQRGALFKLAMAHSNWTVPATASLLTSLYPSEHGAGLEGAVRKLGNDPPNQLRSGTRTLGDILHDAGFHTGLFSANPYLYGRFKRGFDAAEVDRKNATALTDAALTWLEGASSGPFFLYMQYMDLHQPIEPPEPYFSYFKVAEGGERGKQHTDWSYGRQTDLEDLEFRRFRAHRLALYDGALRYVDAEIGRLLNRLEELGIAGQTLLVVTSDHGEEFWDHAAIEHQLGGDPRGLWGIGHGHSMFQELLWVPLIFYGPGVGEARTVGCLTRHVDVLPTVIELLGLAPPEAIRGQSLVPLLRPGRGRADCEPLALVAESPAYGPNSKAVVWNDHKLILRQDGVKLLYDLAHDAGETTDLSRSNPELMSQLQRVLGRELLNAKPQGDSQPLDFDAETREQLKSLGYIQGDGG